MSTEKLLQSFKEAVQIDTSWPEGSSNDAQKQAEKALDTFGTFIRTRWPLFAEHAETILNDRFAQVLKLSGKDSSLKPVLLLAHYDVVPVEEKLWSISPFGAEEKDGFIWGRGTLDTKNSLTCMLQALEDALERGWQPQQDVWVALGGDEERSGLLGAAKAAQLAKDKGISFSWCLDEGSIVAEGMIQGISAPLALIGIEEKGFVNIELSVEQAEGHSARPPKVQAAAVLGKALCRLQKHPFPWRLSPTVEAFFTALAPHLGGIKGFVMRHSRLLGRLFFPLAASTPDTAALMRTTVAMTQLSGSPADNVMPSRVSAILNLRLLSPWTTDSALAYVRRHVRDKRVQVRISPARQAKEAVPCPPAVAAGKGPGWELLSAAITGAFPGCIQLPFLVTVTTDSSFWAPLCEAVYRFSPMRLNKNELRRIHGRDERISIDNLEAGYRFYSTLISSLGA